MAPGEDSDLLSGWRPPAPGHDGEVEAVGAGDDLPGDVP